MNGLMMHSFLKNQYVAGESEEPRHLIFLDFERRNLDVMEVTVSAFPGRLRLRPEGDAPHTGVLDGKAEFNCFFYDFPCGDERSRRCSGFWSEV